MPRILLLLGVIGAACLMATKVAAEAKERGVFEVRDIKVDITADTAAMARELALAEGERKAFQVLLDRLTLPRDQASQRRFTPAEISAATKDFWVSEEKVSPIRYIATLNYEFHGNRVRELLDARGIPYVTAVAPPVVIIPVYQDASGIRLWQPPNPWLDAVASISVRGLVPFVVPKTGAAELLTVDAQQALKFDEASLVALGRRFDTGELVVAHASLQPAPGSSDQQLTVVMKRRLGFGPTADTSTTYRIDPKETANDLFKRAAEATLAQLENDWKEANRVEGTGAGVMALDILVNDLKSWLAVEKILSRLPAVRRMEPVLFAKGRVRVNLFHGGTTEQMISNLDRSGLATTPNADSWTVRPVAVSPGGTGPL